MDSVKNKFPVGGGGSTTDWLPGNRKSLAKVYGPSFDGPLEKSIENLVFFFYLVSYGKWEVIAIAAGPDFHVEGKLSYRMEAQLSYLEPILFLCFL